MRSHNLDVVQCKNCGKDFVTDVYRARPQLHCSYKCKNRYAQRQYQIRMRTTYAEKKEFDSAPSPTVGEKYL